MFTLERHVLETAALRLEHFEVPWDSEIFGETVVQIGAFEVRDAAQAAQDFAAYDAWTLSRRAVLEVCKLDPSRLDALNWLQQRGFRWVETLYFPAFTGLQAVAPVAPDDAVTLRPARPDELPAVQAIAASAFVTSRYLIDPQICPRRGAERYARWVSNSAADPAQELLVAEVDGELAGFFIVQEREAQGQREAYWHLTAVAPGFQGRGLGKRLWRTVMDKHRQRGCERVRTAVSGHNLPVLGLYGQLGFRFAGAEATLHRGGLAPA